jgi:hypothetical protein
MDLVVSFLRLIELLCSSFWSSLCLLRLLERNVFLLSRYVFITNEDKEEKSFVAVFLG